MTGAPITLRPVGRAGFNGQTRCEAGRDVRAHDLLWLARGLATETGGPMPAWADAAWRRGAPVVMRRECVVDPDFIPVGWRGTTRGERLAAYAPRSAIVRHVTPESLACKQSWRQRPLLSEFAPIIALSRLAAALDAVGLPWGPVGGVGFALASGLSVLHPGSDLDLIVRAHAPLNCGQTAALRDAFGAAGCRVDTQIDTGVGGFSFAEWAAGTPSVLLRTAKGPFLTSDPWCASQPAPSQGSRNPGECT